MRILVVDDEPDVRLIANLSLTHAGHEVIECSTGEGALESLSLDSPPDVILLDIRMPGIDGWEVMRRLQQSPGLGKLPVVVFTAHVSVRNSPEYAETGRPFVLTKPFTREDLLATLDAAMQEGALEETSSG